MRLLGLITAAIISLGSTPALAWKHSSSAYYRSSDGSMVHRPSRSGSLYGHVTATCGDGTSSYSHHHQGTCSHHGGVAYWAPG
jgi:hypothetical protein